MEKIAILKKLEMMCKSGVNIVAYLTDNHCVETTAEDEMISYDIRAGADIELFWKDRTLTCSVVDKIGDILKQLHMSSGRILECGSGEGIKLTCLVNQKGFDYSWAMGIDISWSRVRKAQEFAYQYSRDGGVSPSFIIGDIFNLPLKNNSVDVVYTMQGIYAMGGREKLCIKELYRVASKYVVMIEPSYEFASNTARKRMDDLKYVKNLPEVAESLGYKIVKYEPFGVDSNPMNPAAVLVIKKDEMTAEGNPLCCPVTGKDIELVGNAYYAKDALLSYPVLNGVPCLKKNFAIVTAKMYEYT